MSERSSITTPRGTAHWPVLGRTETFQGKDTGKYVVKIIFTGPELVEMQQTVSDFLVEAYGPKKAATVPSPFKVTKEGETYLRFSAQAVIRDRPRVVALFNAKGAPVAQSYADKLGSGSTIRVKGSMVTFDDKPGVAFYMDSVMIIKLVEFTQGGGFAAEDDADGWTGDEFDGGTTPGVPAASPAASPDF